MTKRSRPVVLVLLGSFWPGHEATGPNQSFRALATALGGEFDFKVIARDRPFGARHALAPSGHWIDQGFAYFRYCEITALRRASGLWDAIRSSPHDILMMNGFFDREFTIPALAMRKLRLLPRRPAILSPRGEFSGGALGLKVARKKAYLSIARSTDLLKGVWLHATAESEAAEISARYPWAERIVVAPTVRLLGPLPTPSPARPGERLRLVFLSRIDRMKNLDYALRVIGSSNVPLSFDIFGPISDEGYWAECQALITRLPANTEVRYRGAIPNSAVRATLSEYDLFILPSRGENFGHAIFDALEAGLPVLLSNRTPWRNLEENGAGWSLTLEQPEQFAVVISAVAQMSPDRRADLSAGARRFAERSAGMSNAVTLNRHMLQSALGAQTSP
jgi:glycosyltransferase involved in cell wall biosynthesis